MAINKDFELEEMENSAVQKSNVAKKVAIGSAAVLGVGTTTAVAADKISDINSVAEGDELDAEGLMAGANAGAIDESVTDETAATDTEAPAVTETHVYHHIVEPAPAPEPAPEIEVTDTEIIFDENGDIVSTVDSGTIDGKEFMVIDSDLNGAGDVLAYDANGNHIFEADEIVEMDNHGYIMGQGENVSARIIDGGSFDQPAAPQPYQVDDDIADIDNDFLNEKDGGEYHGDLADNNPDYRNDGGEQYYAGMDRPADSTIYGEDGMPIANDNYGYDTADNSDMMADKDYGYTSEDDIADTGDFYDDGSGAALA